MLLSTPHAQSYLILALYFFTGVTAAPSPGKILDADVSLGDETFGFLPETSSTDSDGSDSTRISVDNDYKIPSDFNTHHIVTTEVSVGAEPLLCYPFDDDEEGSCTKASDDDEKRSLFSRLSTRALTSDKKEALRLHNAARKKVKVDPLVWDSKLEASALKWAKKIAKNKKMAHSSGDDRSGQGENLAYAYSSASGGFKNPVTAGTKGWLNEKKDYHGEKIPKGNFSDYGHYTQCVWKSSTKIGIATAKDTKGAWYTVARYAGPGNVVGQKPY
ncbi:PR-1 class pathogen related protein [Fusarium heterosporum]|uniref:PR-1 class pathogen related protein n=1 Tax=Fusarium heterosporum TaxID=42747 RepID=A0A8H5WP03_FUSHE|nr:PR-1 class pathogen related protein [Fusarium heterosporum]